MAQLLPENSTLERTVRRAAEQGRLSHAIVLSGTGDLTDAARFIAAAHVCEGTDRPCLRCRHCRKVLEGIHPDVSVIRDTEHRELTVDAVRELRQDVYVRPNEAARKVYIIADSRQLNERDQNVLLKIVEEGPPYAAFLFCTETAAALLPTIRSRCMIVRVGAMPVEQVAEILKRQGVSPERAALAASLSGGYPGTAARYAQDDYMEFRREALLLLEEALFGPSPFAKAAELIKTEENKKKKLSPQRARDLTDILGTLLRDSLPQAAGAPMNTDCQKLRNKIAARFTRGQIQGMINRTLWAQKQLALKAGPGSVTDLLLLELKL